jgi:hypothetical protein
LDLVGAGAESGKREKKKRDSRICVRRLIPSVVSRVESSRVVRAVLPLLSSNETTN